MVAEQNKDGSNGKTPDVKKDLSDGDETPKPGLIIDVVLPDEKPEIERDPKKQN